MGEELSGEIFLCGFGFQGCVGALGSGFDGKSKVIILANDKFGVIDGADGLIRVTHRLGGSAMNFLVLASHATIHCDGNGSATIKFLIGVEGREGLFIGLVEGGIVVRNFARVRHVHFIL